MKKKFLLVLCLATSFLTVSCTNQEPEPTPSGEDIPSGEDEPSDPSGEDDPSKEGEDKKLVSIEVGGGYKEEYYLNEEFDYESLKVYAIYEDGSREELNKNSYTVTGFNSETENEDLEVTITYQEQTFVLHLKVIKQDTRQTYSFKANVNRYLTEGEPYEFDFKYDSDYFSQDNTVRNDKLANFAFAFASNSGSVDRFTKVYKNAGFDTAFTISSDYETITDNSIGYAFGYKEIDDNYVVVLTIRGEDYGNEWASNLSLTSDDESYTTSNHYGFDLSAYKVLDGFTKWARRDNSLTDKPIKMLITGYSRGGAVADLVAKKLIDTKPFDNIALTDIYTYTFEAPASAAKDGYEAENYKSIFNYINGDDLIINIPPRAYGFIRPGVEIKLNKETTNYNQFVTDELAKLDPANEISPFTETELFTAVNVHSYEDLINYLLDSITREVSADDLSKGVVSFATLEDYKNNLQEPLTNTFKFIFNNEEIANILKENMFSLMGALGTLQVMDETYDQDALYTSVKSLFDSKSVSYDDTKLKSTCKALQMILRTFYLDQYAKFGDTASSYLLFALLSAMNIIKYHYLETEYVLVNGLINKVSA